MVMKQTQMKNSTITPTMTPNVIASIVWIYFNAFFPPFSRRNFRRSKRVTCHPSVFQVIQLLVDEADSTVLNALITSPTNVAMFGVL